MSGRKFAALLIAAGAGAAVAGLPGALIGYLAVMVVAPFVPALRGGSCDVPQTEQHPPAEAEEQDRSAA